VLIALGAQLACVHPDGDRTLDAALLYAEPKKGQLNNTTLRPGELIRGVVLEASPLTKRSTYVEFRERESFDFAAVSVAVALDMADGVVRDARIVLGAVAPAPYRAKAVEDALRGKPLDAKKAAKLAMKGAEPLEQSAYKVTIAETLVRRALEELTR
jgi:xanthine dehydrogenase YagS FAD-binding subunit